MLLSLKNETVARDFSAWSVDMSECHFAIFKS